MYLSYHCWRIMQRLWNAESMNKVNGVSNVATAMLKHRLRQCGTIEEHLTTSTVGCPACDHIEQRLFAAAFRSENRHHLATVQRQIDTFQHQRRISVAIQASATVHLNVRRHSMRIAFCTKYFHFSFSYFGRMINVVRLEHIITSNHFDVVVKMSRNRIDTNNTTTNGVFFYLI